MLSKSTQLPKCYTPSVEDKDAFKMNILLLIIKGNAVEKEKERPFIKYSSVFFVCNKCNNK